MSVEEQIKQKLKKQATLKTAELVDLLHKENPLIPHSSLLKQITLLTNRNVVCRIRKGEYALANSNKKVFNPLIDDKTLRIAGEIAGSFPLVTYCLSETRWINGFSQHLASNNYILVEVEKELVESVANKLKDKHKDVFINPSASILQDYASNFSMPIVVRNLISEAPILKINTMPIASIEKLLVDLLCNEEYFYLQGHESIRIFKNALHSSVVNLATLKRYASRRGKKLEVEKIIAS